MLLGLIKSTYLDAAESFGWGAGGVGKEVAVRLLALLRLLNQRTADLILGQSITRSSRAP
eukprot:COSAG05_NODE_18893_length_301_cov_0.683168_1_plen_60_part_10